ncbi:hypothetical protein [Pseudoxanthomonas sp. 10H]|uniref:hypothetical protein n=1 Tax=Pseudoxanthomonas sp. 10H TaxID=3242729 RepID=UPI003555EB70
MPDSTFPDPQRARLARYLPELLQQYLPEPLRVPDEPRPASHRIDDPVGHAAGG